MRETTEDGAAVRPVAQELAARLERQLAAAQQITHIGSFEWDLATNTVTWSDELYRIYGLEPQSCEITLDVFLSKLHPDDRARVRSEIGLALERGGRFSYIERIVRPDGAVRELETVGELISQAEGRAAALIGTCRDVTLERERDRTIELARQLQSAERRVLEMIAAGRPLEEVLTTLVLLIEERAPPAIGSILLLDSSRTRISHGAAPHLPAEYNSAIVGEPIGPGAGSCGTAAFLRQPVLVNDIESDPLWVGYRDLARRFGLRACWSMPILASDERVLGTFALYYREPRSPTPSDLEVIARATHVAGIAIQRHELDEQLRALSARIEAVREEERTGVAREIHDELGQALTALKMDVAWIARHADSEAGLDKGVLLEKLGGISEMTDGIIDGVRRISAALRPGVLDDLGLVAAIEWQAQEFERRTSQTCAVHASIGDARFARQLSTDIFRIFQEALTNVARHADAKHVEVRLERVEGCLRMEVADDGKGIPHEAVQSQGSLGLLGIRERARRLGGVVSVAGVPGKGTLVVVDVPLAPGAER
jgi:PAS domain S-box-containing protein